MNGFELLDQGRYIYVGCGGRHDESHKIFLTFHRDQVINRSEKSLMYRDAGYFEENIDSRPLDVTLIMMDLSAPD